jgi:cysteine desulfurase
MQANHTLYFDNNATTAVAPEVFEVMVPYLTEHYGNASSAYKLAQRAKDALQTSREKIAKLLNCDAREIIFTSCGTESDNAAIYSALQTTGKKHIITSQVEHSAITKYCERLERQGHAVTWLPVRSDGTLDLAELERALRPDTAIVSLMWANNETGVLFPIQEAAELCRAKGVLFHTDAVQTPGKIPLDLATIPVDFLSLSGHKLHAPKGVGVLFVRKRVRYVNLIVGGGQEGGRRGGTENIPYIVGLGRAAELALEHLIDEQTRVRALRDTFENTVLATIPGTAVNGHRELRLPNTSNLRFEGIEAEALLAELDLHNICASSGSACTTGSMEPSHVLTAMGLNAAQAKASVRFSFSQKNTAEEVDYALALLPVLLQKLRATNPVAV